MGPSSSTLSRPKAKGEEEDGHKRWQQHFASVGYYVAYWHKRVVGHPPQNKNSIPILERTFGADYYGLLFERSAAHFSNLPLHLFFTLSASHPIFPPFFHIFFCLSMPIYSPFFLRCVANIRRLQQTLRALGQPPRRAFPSPVWNLHSVWKWHPPLLLPANPPISISIVAKCHLTHWPTTLPSKCAL
jgi:hypothetical protein